MIDQKQKAIPFIYLQDQKFVVSEQAKSFFYHLKKPLAILTIVGKYRTGKSLFLNKILLKKSQAFKVSPTINSCTKGLWVWKETIKLNNNQMQQEEYQLIVIDTQGFGATQQSDAYNNKILLFAILLSSYFIYNSVGSIDQNSINNLSVIANLAKQIQSKNTKDQKLDQNFPSFLWLVRDFTLNLVNKDNFPIKANEYLEQALQIQKGTSDLIEGKNKIRRIIKHFFKDRDCFTLVRPVQNEEKLQKLDVLDDNQFRQVFVQQANNLREKILSQIRIKKLKNCKLNGQMLIELAMNYVQVINQGSLPNFQNSYKYLLKRQIQNVKKSLLKDCQTKVQKLFLQKIKNNKQMKILSKNVLFELQQMCYKRLKMLELAPEQLYNIIGQIRKQIEINIQKATEKKYSNEKNIFLQKLTQIKEQNIGKNNFLNFEEVKEFLKRSFQKLNNSINQFLQQNKIQLIYQHFTPWKEQLLTQFIYLQSMNYHTKNTQLEQKMKIMSQQLTNQKNLKNQLQKKLKMVENERHSLKCHLQETKKQFQVTKQNKERELSTNLRNIQKLQITVNSQIQQIQQLKNNLSSTQAQLSDLNKRYCILESDKSFLQKQLSITKNSLNSKIEEIMQKKQMIKVLENELRNFQQKYEIVVNQSKAQINGKEQLYSNLLEKYESLHFLFTEQSKTNIKLQTQLLQKNHQINNQKAIFQSVFQTLKGNYFQQTNTKNQLLQINKNLTQAVRNLQRRAEQADQKQSKLKQYKKSVKNSSCIQCLHCTRFFVPSIFLTHLNICNSNSQNLQNQNKKKQISQTSLTLKVKSATIKQEDFKPYTQYKIQCRKNNKSWIIDKKYKQLCDLNSNLQKSLPGVQLSSVDYIVNPQEGSKKSFSMDERKKIIESYLKDLSQNQFVQKSQYWNEFVKLSEVDSLQMAQLQINETKKSGLTNIQKNNKLNNSSHIQSPQQFFKIWQQRQNRGKSSSSSITSSKRKQK